MPAGRVVSVGARRWVLFAATALVAVSGSLIGAPVAPAAEPAGRFGIFRECPRFTIGVDYCLYAQTLGGEVTIGRLTLPLERPLLLQGGIARNEQQRPVVETFFGALDGETFLRSPQRVPGGLFGMPLYATLELASPASDIEISSDNIVNEEGTAVGLPVRIHLENPLFGSECYLGSHGNPIAIHLTTGTTRPNPPNKPISGKLVALEQVPGPTGPLLEVAAMMVDNTFSIPGATGCGGRGEEQLVDATIDHALGLPSPDGHNTIVQNNTIWTATAEDVIADEGG